MNVLEEAHTSMDITNKEETTFINEQQKEEQQDQVQRENMSMTQEEEESQRTLQAYDQLLEIKEKLVEDNTQYELHVKYIELLKQLDLQEQLEEARVAMHDIYPLTEQLWLDWINDTKKDTSVEGQVKLITLYNHAEQDYLSINIWKDFAEYVLDKFHQEFTPDIIEPVDTISDFIEQTRQDLLKAVRATSVHIQQSQEVWKLYSEFEFEILERFKDPEQLERVQKMYLDRLAVLHTDVESTFNAYSTFVSSYYNSNYEDTMVKANKIYAKTKKAAEERDYYEMQLVSLGYSMEAFNQYIDYEKRTKIMFSLTHVRSIYERAIVYHCTDPILWDDYILFLIEHAKVQIFMETTCLRAIRNCPWSGTLWAHLARVMEFGNKPEEQIDDIFDRALSSKTLLSSVEDLVTVLLAKCDFKRRKIDWEEFDQDAVMNLQVAFEESLQYISEALPDSGDPYYRIEKYYAYICHKRLGDIEKAREIWQSVVEQHGMNTEAWIDYIMFEKEQNNYGKCESLFKQAIQKNTDNPARLISIWSSFEHEIGTLESYEISLVRINRASRMLSNQWQTQYQSKSYTYSQDRQKYKYLDQQKPINTKQKKEMDRKKKSAHRLAQKHRAKEKRKEKAMIEHSATETEEHVDSIYDDENNNNDNTIVENDIQPSEASFFGSEQEQSSLKRKLSTEEDDATNDNTKRHKTNEEQKSRTIRPNTRRGKSVKLPQKTLGRSDVEKIKQMNHPNEDDANKAPDEKTNDDFRAMLLSRKKK